LHLTLRTTTVLSDTTFPSTSFQDVSPRSRRALAARDAWTHQLRHELRNPVRLLDPAHLDYTNCDQELTGDSSTVFLLPLLAPDERSGATSVIDVHRRVFRDRAQPDRRRILNDCTILPRRKVGHPVLPRTTMISISCISSTLGGESSLSRLRKSTTINRTLVASGQAREWRTARLPTDFPSGPATKLSHAHCFAGDRC